MTTLQKIKNLTWWNEIAKLKIILTEILNNVIGKQNTLVSGTNIKTINSATILGSGNIVLATIADTKLIAGLPTYADNAAAVTGGLVVNSLYKTATGELRIRI